MEIETIRIFTYLASLCKIDALATYIHCSIPNGIKCTDIPQHIGLWTSQAWDASITGRKMLSDWDGSNDNDPIGS